MLARRIVLAAGCGALALGCAGQASETDEIVENLERAGFPGDDIMIVDHVVYVGRDAEVSLAASREMLEIGDSDKEQYRTNNLVSPSLTKICIDGSTFTGVFSTALDLAIQNYDVQPLTFAMARTPSAGCSFTITGVIQPGLVGGKSGFPAGGLPFGTINIGGGLSTFSVDTIEHVITHEIGHTIGFRHSDFFDRSISCGLGGNEGDGGVGATLIAGTPSGAVVGGSLMNSCFRDVETGEFTASDVSALIALYRQSTAQGHANSDFDGDTRADFTVWRPSSGTWFTIRSTTGVTTNQAWGEPGDIPAAGDYDGDGKADLAVWRPGSGTWFVIRSSDGVVSTRQWGEPGDVPVPADYDGDRRTDLAVWRPSTGTWFVIRSSNGSIATQIWGLPGDVPSPGDYDGDGRSDFTVWRPSGGTWLVIRSGDGGISTKQWGAPGDLPVAADYDGDRRTDLAVWRPSSGTWFVIRSGNGSVLTQQWGLGGDLPVVVDFDGDGRSDLAVWRPSSGTWFVVRSSNGAVLTQAWGQGGDVPVSVPVGG